MSKERINSISLNLSRANGQREKARKRQLAASLSVLMGITGVVACKQKSSQLPSSPADRSKNHPGNTDDGAQNRVDDSTQSPSEKKVDQNELDLFFFGRVLGTIEPCGCTADPLGGLQYLFGYIESQSTAGRRLIIEPGSFLYPDPSDPEAPTDEDGWKQAEQKALALHQRFSSLGPDLVSGLGPTDLASPIQNKDSLGKWKLPRTLANLRTPPAEVLAWRKIQTESKLTIGVTQILEKDLATDGFPELKDEMSSLGETLKEMTSADLALRILVIHGSRKLAEQAAKQFPELDVIVMGGPLASTELGRTGKPPARVGKTWIVQPGDRTQNITHLTLHPTNDGGKLKLHPASEWKMQSSKSAKQAEIQRMEERLAKFKADPSADANYLARLESQLKELKNSSDSNAESDKTQATFEQVKITCRGEADTTAQKVLHDYSAWVAETNRKRFEGVKAPSPAKGQPHYVGVEECSMCHDEATEFWQDTIHAKAYKTLADANKQFDLSCIGCHVTGFKEPGGSHVVENEGLRDVQCEQCHGPGSLHIEEPEDNSMIVHTPVDTCLSCHTPEHSDTFEYQAYLRDILGPGHGQKAREKLGDGPTAHELRAQAVAKAGGKCPMK